MNSAGAVASERVFRALEVAGAREYKDSRDYIDSPSKSLLGIIGFLATWALTTKLGVDSPAGLAALFLIGVSAPMILCHLLDRAKGEPLAGLGRSTVATPVSRILYKVCGLGGAVVVLSTVYATVPEYAKAYYRPFFPVAGYGVVVAAIFIPAYVVYVDRRMREPEDGCYHAGLFFTGQWSKVKFDELRLFALGWTVKGFFLPFMIGGAAERLMVLHRKGIDVSHFYSLYSTVLNLIYCIDIVFGAVGYVLTLRALDAQIKSVDSTLLGWLSAICCYAPFSVLIWAQLLHYSGERDWYATFHRLPALCVGWALVIILLHLFYVWSTCSFGLQFSNLTNRGILTRGPYRFVKHPSYLAKNVAWWLMAVPFMGHASIGADVRACACLLVTNGIYGVRAWTEERHLRSDPNYLSYCEWMEKHGLFARISRTVRGLFK